MASLKSTNPHARNEYIGEVYGYAGCGSSDSKSIEASWKKAAGDAVADESKLLLAIDLGGRKYVLADVRYVHSNPHLEPQRVVLEFFFDGELSQLEESKRGNTLKSEFVSLLQARINECVSEYFRRVIKSLVEDTTTRSKAKNLRQPDTTINFVGAHIDDAFRDAGCMLKFIAVKVSLSYDCSPCIGAIVFPEYFGVSVIPKALQIPKWILGMGLGAIILGIGMLYAWFQILVVGNRFI
jgi:hypothetical protein